MLLQAALEKLSGYAHIFLWVLRENSRAIRFYEKNGFRFDGTQRDILLGTPVTELRMYLEK